MATTTEKKKWTENCYKSTFKRQEDNRVDTGYHQVPGAWGTEQSDLKHDGNLRPDHKSLLDVQAFLLGDSSYRDKLLLMEFSLTGKSSTVFSNQNCPGTQRSTSYISYSSMKPVDNRKGYPIKHKKGYHVACSDKNFYERNRVATILCGEDHPERFNESCLPRASATSGNVQTTVRQTSLGSTQNSTDHQPRLPLKKRFVCSTTKSTLSGRKVDEA